MSYLSNINKLLESTSSEAELKGEQDLERQKQIEQQQEKQEGDPIKDTRLNPEEQQRADSLADQYVAQTLAPTPSQADENTDLLFTR